MLLKIKVKTGQKQKEVVALKQGEFLLKVKAKPEQGKANQEVLFLLAKYFNISLAKLKIVRGHKTKNKIIGLDILQNN